jgi:glycosyltransferase involved in cell wall biosynthesis
MNIGFDTSPLSSGHKARGTGRYARFLFDSLQKSKKHTIVEINRTSKINTPLDLIHFPFFDPFFLTLHINYSIPYVVTVHDLIPLDYPDHFPRGFRGEIKWQIQKKILEKSLRIITDSHASKESIIKHIRFPKDNIDVIPLASTIQKPIQNQNDYQRLINHHGIPEQYFLYVGDVNWNKNIIGMLIAFQSFNEYQKSNSKFINQKIQNHPISLVLVGKAFFHNPIPETNDIITAIKNLGIKDNVRVVGKVTDTELGILYSHALATILPSFAEGFGLPILEAMRCGSPVITSNTSSMKEIAGPAFLCDPTKPDSIVLEMLHLCKTSFVERKKCITDGYTWEQNYSWDITSELTIRSYEKAISKR